MCWHACGPDKSPAPTSKLIRRRLRRCDRLWISARVWRFDGSGWITSSCVGVCNTHMVRTHAHMRNSYGMRDPRGIWQLCARRRWRRQLHFIRISALRGYTFCMRRRCLFIHATRTYVRVLGKYMCAAPASAERVLRRTCAHRCQISATGLCQRWRVEMMRALARVCTQSDSVIERLCSCVCVCATNALRLCGAAWFHIIWYKYQFAMQSLCLECLAIHLPAQGIYSAKYVFNRMYSDGHAIGNDLCVSS